MNKEVYSDSWEDLSDSVSSPLSSTVSQRSVTPVLSSRSGTTRRRKAGHKIKSNIGTNGLKKSSYNLNSQTTNESPKHPKSPRLVALPQGWGDTAVEAAFHVLRFTWDVILSAIRMLRRPLSILLFLYLLALIMNRISNLLRATVAPLCFIPGISNLRVCMPDPAQQPVKQRIPKRADYPKLIDVQSNAFEKLLSQSVGSGALSLDIRSAEIATRDLVSLVHLSKLKTKDLLAETLSSFVDDARKASRGLQKLNAKIGGAVDGISAVNDYALHSIEEAYAKELPWYSPKSLIPWSPRQNTKEVIKKTFHDAMNVLSRELHRLILEAENSLINLDRLEEHLATLHDIIAREDASISQARAELLAYLWTMLGGNRDELRGHDLHLALLKDLGGYRKLALSHVTAALQMLHSLSDELEDLRERVALPELAGSEIPIEVHLKSIQNGLDRLKSGRLKAKELEERAINRINIDPPNP